MYKKKKRKSKKDFSSLIQQLSLAAAVGGPDRDWHGKQKNGGNGGGGMNIIAQKKNLGVLYINSALKMSALTQVKGIDQKSKVPNVVKSNGVCCLLRRCLISRPEWEKNFMIWYHLMIVCRPLPRSPNGPEFLPTCYDVKRGIDLVIWPATDVVSYLFGRKEWERERKKSSEIFYLYVCIFSSSRSTTSSWLRVGHTAKKSKQRTGKFIVSSRSPLSLSLSWHRGLFFFPSHPDRPVLQGSGVGGARSLPDIFISNPDESVTNNCRDISLARYIYRAKWTVFETVNFAHLDDVDKVH